MSENAPVKIHGIRLIPALCRCQRGAAAVEFVLIAPLLITMLLGICFFGIAANQYLLLSNAAAQGAQALGNALGLSTPYTTASNAVIAAAPTLTLTSTNMTMTVGSSPCTKDSSCPLVAGQVATVQLTYPCNLLVISSCQLSTESAAVIQ